MLFLAICKIIMLTTTQAIVLTSIKYGDTSLIVRMYTLSGGMRSYMVKGVRTSRKSGIRTSYFQPFTPLEIVGSQKNNGQLEHVKEVRMLWPAQQLHANLITVSQLVFLSEVLGNVLREEESNREMFTFLIDAIHHLEENPGNPNFYLGFLIHLTGFLGFSPNQQGTDLPFFDLAEGAYSRKPSRYYLEGTILDDFKWFQEHSLYVCANRGMTGVRRRNLVQALMQYYQLHLPDFRSPRSLEVLSQMFS